MRRAAAVVLAAVLALPLAGCNRDVHDAPDTPDNVCPLVGTDLLERAVPGGHQTPVFRDHDSDFGNVDTCQYQTPGDEPANGAEATQPYRIIQVTVKHVAPGYIKEAETEAKSEFKRFCRDAGKTAYHIDKDRTCYGVFERDNGYLRVSAAAREGADLVLVFFSIFSREPGDPQALVESVRDHTMTEFQALPEPSPS